MILSIRTDKPEAELGLFDKGKKIDELVWVAHRQLAETINRQIRDLLAKNKIDLANLTGIVCFKGPGSFTGLRIGLTVASTLAQQLKIPIVGLTGINWESKAVKNLLAGQDDKIVLPEYGSEPHITQQKR